jgi:hypothetical protein
VRGGEGEGMLIVIEVRRWEAKGGGEWAAPSHETERKLNHAVSWEKGA